MLASITKRGKNRFYRALVLKAYLGDAVDPSHHQVHGMHHDFNGGDPWVDLPSPPGSPLNREGGESCAVGCVLYRLEAEGADHRHRGDFLDISAKTSNLLGDHGECPCWFRRRSSGRRRRDLGSQ
jgi:hypothetical protein